MPVPDASNDLRALIERVEAANGPLRFDPEYEDITFAWADALEDEPLGRQHLHEITPGSADILAGVLRRDLEAHHPGPIEHITSMQPTTGGRLHTVLLLAEEMSDDGDRETLAHGAALGPLVALLHLWLDAHSKGLVGRQEDKHES